jgi:hypothetical protein
LVPDHPAKTQRVNSITVSSATASGTERFDGTLRAEVEIIGPETDDLATQRFEGV